MTSRRIKMSRIKSLFNIIKLKIIYNLGKKKKYDIKVIPASKCVDEILSKKVSVARFGDGEFNIIRGKSIGYQKYDKTLANRMLDMILRGSNDKIMICLPDVFQNMDRYNDYCDYFYNSQFFVQNEKILRKIEDKYLQYGSTFISRPYIDLKDKSTVSGYFNKIKRIWKDRDILIVEGKYSRSGEGNDLFDEARSIQRIICPDRDAYFSINKIEDTILKFCDGKLVFIMLGPTTKIIVDDMVNKYHKIEQFFDLGHIDSEYEWFKMGATEKVALSNKHTAEHNQVSDIVLPKKDKEFENQVIARVY